MNIANLIITLLFTATASASPVSPLVFAAKIDGVLEPLSDLSYEADGLTLSVWSYGSSPSVPVEFDLEGDFAIARTGSTPGYLAFDRGLIVYGPGVNRTKLIFDNQMRLQNAPFRACKVHGTGKHVIFYGSYPIPANNCVETEIYLVSYDRTTGSIMDFAPMF